MWQPPEVGRKQGPEPNSCKELHSDDNIIEQGDRFCSGSLQTGTQPYGLFDDLYRISDVQNYKDALYIYSNSSWDYLY